MIEKLELKRLKPIQSAMFYPLTMKRFWPYLNGCDRREVLAVGASCDGMPCGLALFAETAGLEAEADGEGGGWRLLSFYVRPAYRRRSVGRGLWLEAAAELKRRGALSLCFQGILKEKNGRALCSFLEKTAAARHSRLASIYRFVAAEVGEAALGRRSKNRALHLYPRFRPVSFEELGEEQKESLRRNEGQWYPPNLSPFIGASNFNAECTLFALEKTSGEVAGWITVLEVNGGADLLYRTFFARAEYRNSRLGLYILMAAISRHLENDLKKGVLFAVAEDNPRMKRLVELLFRNVKAKMSYEYEICVLLNQQRETEPESARAGRTV